MYNDWWDFDTVFSGPNEEHVVNCNPVFLDFDQTKPMGDLDNPIIPLFAGENWLLEGFVKNPNLLWKNMQPALRMASLFLTVPQAAWAYLPLTLGVPLEWKGEGQLLSYDDEELMQMLPKDSGFLAESLEHVGRCFAELASKVKFTFATFGTMDRWEVGEKTFTVPKDFDWYADKTPQVHGAHHAPGEPYLSEIYVTGDPSELEACKSSRRILLNGAYAEFLQQDLSEGTPTKVARTLFTLGITLVHELSHALYCHEKHPEICESGNYTEYTEPHIFTDVSEPEIGCAIERRLFGNHWQAIVHPKSGACMDSVHVPCTWDDGKLIVGRNHFVNFIEPKWCHDFLTKAKWQTISSIPLEDSRTCCNWPSAFRVHGRTKVPSIKTWWEAKDRGEKPIKMSAFDRDPGYDAHDGWEFVYGVPNWNVDRTWDPSPDDYNDFVMAVTTLDREFLEWKVQEARKARERQATPKAKRKLSHPATPRKSSVSGTPYRPSTMVSQDNIIELHRHARNLRISPTEDLDNVEPTTPSKKDMAGKPQRASTSVSMDSVLETPRSRQSRLFRSGFSWFLDHLKDNDDFEVTKIPVIANRARRSDVNDRIN